MKNLHEDATYWQTPATDSFRSRGGDRVNEMGLDQQSRFWPTPKTVTGGASPAEHERIGSGRGDLQSAAELFRPVAESNGPRRTETGSGPVIDTGREFEPRRSSMGNANESGLEGRIMPGSGRSGERIIGPAVSELADSELQPGSAEQFEYARERPDSRTHDRSVSGDPRGIPLFAPGPGATEQWQDLLVRHPELRPAWSQAEAESHFHGTDDAMARMVVYERTDALRACGNGCVPVQVACAIRILAKRFSDGIE